MDFNDLKSQVSNLTLYDLKAGFRKAQNGASGSYRRVTLDNADRNGSGYELHRTGGQGICLP